MKWQALSIVGIAVAAGCASYVAPTKEESTQAIKSSFNARGIAKLDRLDQSEIQAVCSDAQRAGKEVSKAQREALEKKVLATVKYPDDGKYLGDFKTGERIAQSGVGMTAWDSALKGIRRSERESVEQYRKRQKKVEDQLNELQSRLEAASPG